MPLQEHLCIIVIYSFFIILSSSCSCVLHGHLVDLCQHSPFLKHKCTVKRPVCTLYSDGVVPFRDDNVIYIYLYIYIKLKYISLSFSSTPNIYCLIFCTFLTLLLSHSFENEKKNTHTLDNTHEFTTCRLLSEDAVPSLLALAENFSKAFLKPDQFRICNALALFVEHPDLMPQVTSTTALTP